MSESPAVRKLSVKAMPPAPKIVDLPVDQEWLQSEINEVAKTKGKITGTTCTIIGEGKGFLSIVVRVLLDWDASAEDLKSLPGGVIIKKPTMEKIEQMNETMREFMTPEMLKRAHNQECDAYKFFNMYQPAPLPMARCFHMDKIEDDKLTGMLILEDLTHCSKSFHFNDDSNIEALMNMAGHLGELQAYGFNHQEECNQLIGLMSDNPIEQMIDSLHGTADMIRERYPDKFTYSKEQFEKVKAVLMDHIWLFKDPASHGFPMVMNLGDVQPNNILWKLDSTGKIAPEVAAFIDFQICSRGSAVNDIAVMLFLTQPAEERRKNTRKILEHQLESFKKHAKKPVPITIEQLMDLWDIAMLAMGVVFGMVILDLMITLGEMMGVNEERRLEMLDRIVAGLNESKARFGF